MPAQIKTFADPSTLADAFATEFAHWLSAQTQPTVTVALSGGSTPKLLFTRWASQFAGKIDWTRVHFFWCDERCVAPDDPDSNYGVAKELFLDSVKIPAGNVHRMIGESAPADERARYETEVAKHVAVGDNGLPVFDSVMLGMGDDGHTASIFPHESQFLKSSNVCEVATHPTSGQKRITLTGPVLNNAKKVAFLITGAGKADVLADVVGQSGQFDRYPASHISVKDLTFYLDQPAAAKL
ncbi:MAG: 6-phosphogluconolactonase [Rubripirellula sp.]